MGEDCGSWLPRQHFDWPAHNRNSLTVPYNLGQENTVIAHMNPSADTVPTNENFPVCAVAELPVHQRIGQANEPRGWFYCLPQFRHALAPVTVSTVKEEVPACPYGNSLEAVTPIVGPGCAEKRFLVFDQSGDQTTLIFGSDIRKPVQFPDWIKQFPVIPGACNLNGYVPGPECDINHPLEPILTGKLNENHEVSEMHEDTEELNALLYSDDGSDYTEDDEVTSTGHSPGSVTDHGKSDSLEGRTDDAASCNKPAKKRRLCDDNVHSLRDTASSGNPKVSSEYECDAESSHAGGNSPSSDKIDSLSKNKRMRKEKIKETISILQRIIPGGKGKDSVVVLDEAIQYLISLKLKAKALGLGTL